MVAVIGASQTEPVVDSHVDDEIALMLGRLSIAMPKMRRIACESQSMAREAGMRNAFDEQVLNIDRRLEDGFVALLQPEPLVGAIYSEDSGLIDAGGGPLTAILDPVDGTRNYSMGLSYYAGSIAFVDDGGRCLAAAVTNLVTGKTFLAHRGQGATVRGQPLATRDATSIADVDAIFVGLSRLPEEIHTLAALAERLHSYRAMGCSALDLCCLAEGRTVLTLDLSRTVKVVDVLAAGLIVAEAGGLSVTDAGRATADLLVGDGPIQNRPGITDRPRLVSFGGPQIARAVEPLIERHFPRLFAQLEMDA